MAESSLGSIPEGRPGVRALVRRVLNPLCNELGITAQKLRWDREHFALMG